MQLAAVVVLLAAGLLGVFQCQSTAHCKLRNNGHVCCGNYRKGAILTFECSPIMDCRYTVEQFKGYSALEVKRRAMSTALDPYLPCARTFREVKMAGRLQGFAKAIGECMDR